MSKGRSRPLSYRELREKLWVFGVSDAHTSTPGKTRVFASGISMSVGTPNTKYYTVAYKGEDAPVPPIVVSALLKYFGVDQAEFAAATPDAEATRAALSASSARSDSEHI